MRYRTEKGFRVGCEHHKAIKKIALITKIKLVMLACRSVMDLLTAKVINRLAGICSSAVAPVVMGWCQNVYWIIDLNCCNAAKMGVLCQQFKPVISEQKLILLNFEQPNDLEAEKL